MKVACTGDIMLDGDIEKMIFERAPEHLLSNVRDLLLGHDVVFANLECPLTRCQEVASKEHEGGAYAPTLDLVFVPEPATLTLLGAGLAAAALRRRKRRRPNDEQRRPLWPYS